MEHEAIFSYRYSADENREILAIRKKYLPREESRLEELSRLDHQVQTAGLLPGLTVGVLSCLLFGMGLCFGLEVIGSTVWLGIPFGVIGIVGMAAAYPLYHRLFQKAKAAYTPRILQLAAELTGEKHSAV